MGIFKDAMDKGKKSIIKHKVKSAVNEKLGLDGQHDEFIGDMSDKVIDKIGVDNIIKAKKALDKLKKSNQ